MTQEATPVGGEPIAPEPTLEDRLSAALNDEEQQQEDEIPAEGEEGIEPETAEAADDEPDIEVESDDLPPIEAPVSWDAEAKAVFASLPREAQEIVHKREAERERFVQQKSQEAARARTEVEQIAVQQLAEIDRNYAAQYQQTAQILEQLTADPDYSLLATNPQEFARQAEVAKYYRAQLQQAQRLAEQHSEQANQRDQYAAQQEAAREHQVIVEHFPEYLDPTTGPKLRQELSGVARELGYPNELIEQARAPDILAMKTAAEWKAKADKYDGLMAKKMEKVRAAKTLPKVATPGTKQAPGAAQRNQYAADREAMRRGDKDAELRVLRQFLNN